MTILMKRRPGSGLAAWLAIVAAGFAALPGAAQDIPDVLSGDQCVACHSDVGYLPEGMILAGPHMRVELSCAGCHGGDNTTDDEDIAHAGTFRGVPDEAAIPAFCGRCHSDLAFMRAYSPSASTDQESNYFTSVHGQRLREGDTKVAQCASCHTAHAVLPASDARSTVHPMNVPALCNDCHGDAEYMAEYGIRTTQYRDYARSVHGTALLEREDLGAPACNDCHGNHGAQPPGIESIEHVCGMCHVNNAAFFSATSMARAFAEEELHACEECHGIHDVQKTFDAMVGTGDDSVCTVCHEEGDDGYAAAEAIYAQLVALAAAQDSASTLAERVREIGMDDIEIGFLLRDAHESLIQSRTLVHTFDPERTAEATTVGMGKATEAIELGHAEIRNFRFRRFGFGIATLLITVLTVALFFKIREMERP
jgi:hypothetical protein